MVGAVSGAGSVSDGIPQGDDAAGGSGVGNHIDAGQPIPRLDRLGKSGGFRLQRMLPGSEI